MKELDRQGIGMTSQRTRERMVQRLGDLGISNLRVLEAMLHVPRHLFVDEAFAQRAYEDAALPIAFNQTISQPYIVARMTEQLVNALPDKPRVLEIGNLFTRDNGHPPHQRVGRTTGHSRSGGDTLEAYLGPMVSGLHPCVN